MAIPTSRSDSGIDIQLKALNNPTESGGIMVEGYPITVVEDVIGLQPAVQTWIAQYGSIKFQIWDSATSGTFPPTSGAYNTIYLVPAEGAPDNMYDEYIYVQEEQATDHWEIIGNTQADVSNKMNKAGAYTTSHVLIGVSGGTAIDGGKFLGSNTFNGTSSNYMAREDGVVNYVSGRLQGTSDHVVAFSGGGRLRDTQKIVGGSAFVAVDEAPNTYLATELGVRSFLSTTEAAESLQVADENYYGTVLFANSLDDSEVPSPSATAPSVNAVNAALALTQPRLTFNAPLVSGANNTVSINMATTASSGAVVLTNTPSASGGVAATPALVSTALNGTSNHVVAYSGGGKLKDTGKIVGGATFAATPNASTLATEAGVSAYVASASPKAGLAGYTATSSGLMYVVSSGGALTITSGGLNINAATSSGAGIVQIGSNIEITSGGIISVPTAELAGIGDHPGVVWLEDNVANSTTNPPTAAAVANYVSSAAASGVIPPATSQTLGVVRIGANIVIDTDPAENLGEISVKDGSTASKGVVKLTNTINTNATMALTPKSVNDFINGITGVAPINENLTTTGGTISISSATATQSGAVLIMSAGTFTNAANKVATEGAVFSNCIFYSIV